MRGGCKKERFNPPFIKHYSRAAGATSFLVSSRRSTGHAVLRRRNPRPRRVVPSWRTLAQLTFELFFSRTSRRKQTRPSVTRRRSAPPFLRCEGTAVRTLSFPQRLAAVGAPPPPHRWARASETASKRLRNSSSRSERSHPLGKNASCLLPPYPFVSLSVCRSPVCPTPSSPSFRRPRSCVRSEPEKEQTKEE